MRMGGPARTASRTMPVNRSPSIIGDRGSSWASISISRPLGHRGIRLRRGLEHHAGHVIVRARRANQNVGRGQDRRHGALRHYPIS